MNCRRYVADGNNSQAAELMAEFRREAEAAGSCLHLNHMTSADNLLRPRQVDSRSVCRQSETE